MLRRHLIQGAGAFALAGTHPLTAFAAAAKEAAPPYEWRSVPFGGGSSVGGFAFHPREKGLLYARAAGGGLYRHDPTTRAWIPLLDGLSNADAELMGVLSLALDPDDPDRLYAACGSFTGEWSRKAALLVSADRGATWTINELGIRLGAQEGGRDSGERLQVDPHQGSLLLLGTTRDGLLQSTDRGKSFKSLDFAPRHVSLVLFDPNSAPPGGACRTIWVGSHDQPGLYVSRDGGRSFAREPGTPDEIPQRAVIARDRTLFVTFARGQAGQPTNPGNASTGSVWKRDRDGRWTDITPIKPGGQNTNFGYSGLDVDPRVPGRLIVSTIERWALGDEIFMSNDAGENWVSLGNQSRHDARAYPWLAAQLRGQDRMGSLIVEVKIDPFDSERVVYGTNSGAWMSRNFGATKRDALLLWEFAGANMELTSAQQVVSPSGGALLLGVLGGIAGGAWDRLDASPSTGLFTPSGESGRSVDFAQAKPGLIARTTDGSAGGYVSVDGGASWRPFGPAPRVDGQAAATGGAVAVSAQGGFLLWAPDRGGALFSRDKGRTWTASTGWPGERDGWLKPVADRTVEGVFYVHDRARGRMLQSVDGGQSFQPAFVGLGDLQSWQGSHVVCAPGQLRDLWIALPDGLVHCLGTEKPRQIRAVEEARLVAVGKAAPGASYHSVYVWGRVRVGMTVLDGLFRSDDAGVSFVRIDDDRHRYGRLLSMSADPLEFGTIYLAPSGRGIVVGKPRASA